VVALQGLDPKGNKQCLEWQVSRPADGPIDVRSESLNEARTADDLSGEAELVDRRSSTATEVE
jgi:hypothetical protein